MGVETEVVVVVMVVEDFPQLLGEGMKSVEGERTLEEEEEAMEVMEGEEVQADAQRSSFERTTPETYLLVDPFSLL
eukprot:jgi/Picre1/32938/NNA_008267.t1